MGLTRILHSIFGCEVAGGANGPILNLSLLCLAEICMMGWVLKSGTESGGIAAQNLWQLAASIIHALSGRYSCL